MKAERPFRHDAVVVVLEDRSPPCSSIDGGLSVDERPCWVCADENCWFCIRALAFVTWVCSFPSCIQLSTSTLRLHNTRDTKVTNQGLFPPLSRPFAATCHISQIYSFPTMQQHLYIEGLLLEWYNSSNLSHRALRRESIWTIQ